VRYRKLGQTDLDVSLICQGCWSIITHDTTWGGNALEDSVAAIRASLEEGVNFFDTAEGYGAGESERILAEGLGNRRGEVVIASKVSGGHLSTADVKTRCEASLRNLRTHAIDLYQIHWPNPGIPLSETLGAMEELRSEGKIRHIGVSNFGVSFLRDATEIGGVQSNQLCYSLLWRAVEHEVQPACVAQGLSILCYSPLCQGLLTGKFASADDVPPTRARTRLFSRDRPHSRHEGVGCEREVFVAIDGIRKIADSLGEPMGRVALAWLLGRDGVTSAIAGARNASQARENARAGELELDADTTDRLNELTDTVKRHVGTNADMWQSESRMER
jgi:aryl-alcohol dehydrogenase-like predicted oxidoreductase